MKNKNLNQNHLMVHPNYLRIILLKFIENLIKFLLVVAFYLIMRAQEEEKRLLREK